MPYYPNAWYLQGVKPAVLRAQRRRYYWQLRDSGFSRAGARIRTDIEFPRKERVHAVR